MASAFGSVTGAGVAGVTTVTTAGTATKGRTVGRNIGAVLEAMTLAQPDEGWDGDMENMGETTRKSGVELLEL